MLNATWPGYPITDTACSEKPRCSFQRCRPFLLIWILPSIIKAHVFKMPCGFATGSGADTLKDMHAQPQSSAPYDRFPPLDFQNNQDLRRIRYKLKLQITSLPAQRFGRWHKATNAIPFWSAVRYAMEETVTTKISLEATAASSRFQRGKRLNRSCF